MSKLTKLSHKVFGSLANFAYQMGKFGSFKNGLPEYASSASDIQSLANWEEGLFSSVVGNEAPLIEDFNSAFHHSSRQIGYLYQMGIPEWDSSTIYYINSFCQYQGSFYKSKIDNNTNVTPDETHSSSWEPVLFDHAIASYSSSGFTLPTTARTEVVMSVEDYDNKNQVTTSGSEWKFTPETTGFYTFTGKGELTVNSGPPSFSGEFKLEIEPYLVGAKTIKSEIMNPVGTRTSYNFDFSHTLYLTKGQDVKFFATCAVGNMNMYMEVVVKRDASLGNA